MKKLAVTLGIVVLLGILVLVAVRSVPVFAHRWGPRAWSHGPGYCCQGGGSYGNLTEDQRAELDKVHEKFYKNTAKLRNEIRTKHQEINTLLNASDPDVEKVKALQKEISDRKAKMAQHRIDFELEARKIAPGTGYGRGECARGYGWHMRGQHGPYGDRGPYGGYGHYPCPDKR